MAGKKRKKRKKGRKAILFLIFIALLAAGLYYHKEVIRYSYKAYRLYRHIVNPTVARRGVIDYPLGYSVHGVDVSRWQEEIDWSELKARTRDGDTLNFQFAFIKATQGTWMEDPMFMDNWKAARKNGIIRGAYHYFIPGSDARKQARNFISSVDLEKGDLPPVVDVEETRGKTRQYLVAQLKIFVVELEKKYGVKPLIYSNINFIENYLANDFEEYHFWVAHYYRDELLVDENIKWLFWQHSDKAGMLGCDYYVDVNVFNGSAKQLKKILLQ
jgi:lysozyme